MPSANYILLRSAIENYQQVVCMYKGHERLICPHCIGLKGGREKVLTFQFGGGSSTTLPPGGEWRCMFVDDVSNVRLQNGEWHTADNHSRTQNCVGDVDLEVQFEA